MSAKVIVPGLWEVSLGFVNAFLLESDDGLALIDTGVAGSAREDPGCRPGDRPFTGRYPADPRDALPRRPRRQPGRTEAADRRRRSPCTPRTLQWCGPASHLARSRRLRG